MSLDTVPSLERDWDLLEDPSFLVCRRSKGDFIGFFEVRKINGFYHRQVTTYRAQVTL